MSLCALRKENNKIELQWYRVSFHLQFKEMSFQGRFEFVNAVICHDIMTRCVLIYSFFSDHSITGKDLADIDMTLLGKNIYNHTT